jgi:hypothetical protein
MGENVIQKIPFSKCLPLNPFDCDETSIQWTDLSNSEKDSVSARKPPNSANISLICDQRSDRLSFVRDEHLIPCSLTSPRRSIHPLSTFNIVVSFNGCTKCQQKTPPFVNWQIWWSSNLLSTFRPSIKRCRIHHSTYLDTYLPIIWAKWWRRVCPQQLKKRLKC